MLRHRSSQLQNFGCVLKKGSETHSSLRQSNLQQQNEAALMCRRIRAVEHRCTAGPAVAHPGLQDRILRNYTTGLPTCLHQRKPDLVRQSQIAGLRHIHIKHAQSHTKYTLKLVKNIDITQVQSLEAYSFPVITLPCICFLSITYIIFRATVKFLQYSVRPAW